MDGKNWCDTHGWLPDTIFDGAGSCGLCVAEGDILDLSDTMADAVAERRKLLAQLAEWDAARNAARNA